MPKNWTGELVGLLHDNKITQKQLANELGLSYQYVNLVLRGYRSPPNAEQRFRSALHTLIAEKETDIVSSA